MGSTPEQGTKLNAAFSAGLADILIPHPSLKSRFRNALARTFGNISVFFAECDEREAIAGEIENYRRFQGRPNATLHEVYQFALKHPQYMGEIAIGSRVSLPINLKNHSAFVRRHQRKINSLI